MVSVEEMSPQKQGPQARAEGRLRTYRIRVENFIGFFVGPSAYPWFWMASGGLPFGSSLLDSLAIGHSSLVELGWADQICAHMRPQ